jgi:hypothetical protein
LAAVNRRRLTIPAVLLCAGLGAGCSTFESSDTAAQVGDETLDTDTLTALVETLPSTTGQPGDPNNADDVRNSITLWVQATAIDQYLDDERIRISDDDVTAAEDVLAAQVPGFAEAPADARDVLLDYVSATNALEGLPAADGAEIVEFYELGPESSGITCAAHILVETTEDAETLAAELAAGADFAELAEEHTTDPSGQANGGALPCASTPGFIQSYVPEFVEAALALDIGEISDPVETDFGVHLIQLRPYDDAVAEELASYFASANYRITRAISSADVWVKPRYGTFGDTLTVVPLS